MTASAKGERSSKLPACLPFCFVADSLHSPLLPVSQFIFLAYFFPQSRVKTSGMSLLGLYPQQIQKKKKFQRLNTTPGKTIGQGNENFPDDWKLGIPTQELMMSTLPFPPDAVAQNRNTVQGRHSQAVWGEKPCIELEPAG